MKQRFFRNFLIIFLGPAILLSACSLTPIDETSADSENDVTEVKDFINFNQLDISSAFVVKITQSDVYSISVTADEDLIELVSVTQEGDKVKIFLNPRHIFTDFTMGDKTLRAEITMPALDSLVLSGASTGTIKGFNSINNFNLVVSGASSLNGVDIVTGDAVFEISGASKVGGNLSAGNLDIEVSGASSLDLAGQARNINLVVSGASRVDLTDMALRDGDVTLSGASEATLNVSGELDIELSGASRLFFYGNPVMGEAKVSGASTIKHK